MDNQNLKKSSIIITFNLNAANEIIDQQYLVNMFHLFYVHYKKHKSLTYKEATDLCLSVFDILHKKFEQNQENEYGLSRDEFWYEVAELSIHPVFDDICLFLNVLDKKGLLDKHTLWQLLPNKNKNSIDCVLVPNKFSNVTLGGVCDLEIKRLWRIKE